MLIPCPTCGAQIADTANRCPACGGSTQRGRSARNLWILGVIVLACVSWFAWDVHQSKLRAEERERAYREAIDASNRFLDSQR